MDKKKLQQFIQGLNSEQLELFEEFRQHILEYNRTLISCLTKPEKLTMKKIDEFRDSLFYV